ncbi:hypothetical protein [Peribacillus sp. FSL M8-0224]|uniref:hypothetical protein n=1 Tax=Peribacillus sp. FSL M8-0224 TaxID=2921568 RepID=UPI0030FC7719
MNSRVKQQNSREEVEFTSKTAKLTSKVVEFTSKTAKFASKVVEFTSKTAKLTRRR